MQDASTQVGLGANEFRAGWLFAVFQIAPLAMFPSTKPFFRYLGGYVTITTLLNGYRLEERRHPTLSFGLRSRMMDFALRRLRESKFHFPGPLKSYSARSPPSHNTKPLLITIRIHVQKGGYSDDNKITKQLTPPNPGGKHQSKQRLFRLRPGRTYAIRGGMS